jgi:hypothetical protein
VIGTDSQKESPSFRAKPEERVGERRFLFCV